MRAPSHRARFSPDTHGVSDIVGTILLVGITVVMMTGLAIAVLNTPGPTEKVHAHITATAHPGDDGDWGTGDEDIRFTHRGGEPLLRDRTEIHFVVDGNADMRTGEDLDGAFADGILSIGEVYVLNTPIQGDSLVAIDVIVRGDAPSLVASREIWVDNTQGGSP